MKTKKQLQQVIKTILVFILYHFFTTGLNAQTIDCNNIPILSCGDVYGSQALSTLYENNKFNYENNYFSCFLSQNSFDEADLIFKHEKTDYSDTYVTLFNYGNVDLDLILFDNCDGGELGWRCIDASIYGYGKVIPGVNIDYILLTQPGTYFFVVDGYQLGEKGDFYINIGCDDLQLANCDDVPPVYCDVPKDSTSCLYPYGLLWTTKINNYDCLSNHPKKATMTGRENVTSFTAPEDGEYTISLSNFNQDLDLFIIEDACSGGGGGGGGGVSIVSRSSSYNCIAFSANFGTSDEEIMISLQKNEKIYLVVDGFLDACSDFTLLVSGCTSPDEPCDFCCENLNAIYSDCVGFENYTFGNLLPQGSKKFKLFNPNTSNSSQSGLVVGGGKAKTGNWCLYLDATTDIDYKINRQISDIARLEWSIYFDKDKYGAVGLQIGDQNNYPLFVYFEKGLAKVYQKNANNTNTLLTQFSYTEKKWEQLALIIRSDGRMGNQKGEIELWKDSTFIYKLQNIKINSLVDFNMFYHPNFQSKSSFYIDNICYREQKKAIYFPQYFDWVCVGDQSFANPHYAYDFGYTNCEIKVCESCVEGDFENFNLGNISTQSLTDPWILWPNGGDGVISNEKAYSGFQSLKIGYSNPKSDLVFKLGNKTVADGHWDGNDVYRYSWKMYIPSGKTSYYNMQHAESLQHWAYEVYFNQNGAGSLRYSDPNTQKAAFSFPYDNWFSVTQIIRLKQDEAELWINGKFVDKWQFSTGYKSNAQVSNLNQIGAFNFSHGGSTNAYYFIDNFLCTGGIERCFGLRFPYTVPIVCVNGIQYGNNSSDIGMENAFCDGYSDEEWTVGPCNGTNGRTVTLDVDDDVCGNTGSEVRVPVRVKDYKDIAGLQLKIYSSNDNVAEIIGVGDINASSGITSSDFVVVDKKLILTYADISKTLPDGTILFSVRVLLKGIAGSRVDLNFEGDLLALDNNGTKVTLNGIKGSACIGQSNLTVAGVISNTKEKPIANAKVSAYSNNSIVSTVSTNTNGNYSLSNLQSGKNYKIIPSKDDILTSGVDITDLLVLRRHLQGITLFPSPYTYIAADLNADKKIDISDLLYLRRIMQGLTTQLPNGLKAWRFVPKSFIFPNPGDPLASNIPDAIEFNPLSGTQSNQNFYGIKFGDLDHSIIAPLDGGLKFRNVAKDETGTYNNIENEAKKLNKQPNDKTTNKEVDFINDTSNLNLIKKSFNMISIVGECMPEGDDWITHFDFTKDPENSSIWRYQGNFEDGGAKIKADHSWEINWGNNTFPYGVAELNGYNIPVLAGYYNVIFNTNTMEYNFQKINSNTEVALLVGSISGSSGSEKYIEIKCKNFIKGAAMQFSLSWPPDKLQLVTTPASNSEILIPGTTVFDQTELAQGRLGFIWDTDNLISGTTIADNSICYKLKFKLIGQNNSSAILTSSATPKNSKFLNADLQEILMKIDQGTVNISNSNRTFNEEDLQILIYPNPTNEHINFESEKIIRNLEVLNYTGKVMMNLNNLNSKKGDIDLSKLSSGIYNLKLRTDDGDIFKKISLIK